MMKKMTNVSELNSTDTDPSILPFKIWPIVSYFPVAGRRNYYFFKCDTLVFD